MFRPTINTIRFLYCLILSCFMWLFLYMNKQHVFIIPFAVRYQMEENTINREVLPDEVQLNVTARGWKLLRAISVKHRIDIDIRKSAGDNAFIASQNTALFADDLPQDITINKIFPDTIFFDPDEKIQKKLPVKLNADLSFSPGYNYGGEIKLTPDTIIAEGPRSKLELYDSWNTETISRKRINKNITGTVPLYYKAADNIKLSAIIVQYKIRVDEFIQDRIRISLQNILPDGFTVQPENIVVYYTHPLNSFTGIDSSSFLYNIDFSDPPAGIHLLEIEAADPMIRIDSITGQRINIQKK